MSTSQHGPPPSDGAPFQPPEIEGYDVVGYLGHGSMGVVHEAYQRATGKHVAIKVMLEHVAARERARRLFEREVDLVARLEHPNIVSVIDSGAHRGRYYYIMSYVEGRPLDAALEAGPYDVDDALRLIATIANAVDYAHQRGVLHRDLKPANILIDTQGQPHVLDFGLAKSIDPGSTGGLLASISEPGDVVGTLAYMAPEQARGDLRKMSVRSDVYSLGAIAYQLLTGELPIDVGGPLMDVLQRINEQPPQRPSSVRGRVNRGVDAIILKSLEKAPEQRYQTAAELAAEIGRYGRGEPLIALRGQTLYVVQVLARRHRRLLVTLLCALIAGASVLAWYVDRLRDRQLAAQHLAAALDLASLHRASANPTLREKAIDLLDRAATLNPDFPEALHLRGKLKLFRTHGRSPSEATAGLEDAVADFKAADHAGGEPGYPRALLSAGDAYLARARRPGLTDRHAEFMKRATTFYMAAATKSNDRDPYVRMARLGTAVRADLLRPSEWIEQFKSVIEDPVGRHLLDALAVRGLNIVGRHHVLQDAQLIDILGRMARSDLERDRRADEQLVLRRKIPLADILIGLQRPELAEPLLREAAVLLPDDHRVLHPLFMALTHQHKFEAAAELLEEASRTPDAREAVFGQLHSFTANLHNLGRCTEVHALLTRGIAIAREMPGPTLGSLLTTRGQCLAGTPDFLGAEEAFLEALSIFEATLGSEHSATRDGLLHLVRFYEVWGKPEEAEAFRRRLPPT